VLFVVETVGVASAEALLIVSATVPVGATFWLKKLPPKSPRPAAYREELPKVSEPEVVEAYNK
jgi:hypothetical protein